MLLTIITVLIAILILSSNPGNRHSWSLWWPDHFQYENEYDRDEDKDYDSGKYTWQDQEFDEAFNNYIKYATFNLDAAAGDFQLQGVTSQLYEFEVEGNTGPFSAEVNDVNDERVIIDFTQKRFRGRKNLKNEIHMKLNSRPIWKFNFDVGAANFDMDLTPFKVENIDIDQGAAAISIKLGDLYDKTYVSIDAGASDIEIKVPEESACEVRTHTILSGKDLDGFIKIKTGLYQTPNFSDSANQVIIEIDAAVSGIEVKRY